MGSSSSKNNNNDNRNNESAKKEFTHEAIAPLLKKLSKSICKIKIENESDSKYFTGFLLKFSIEQEIFYCLIFNKHDITNDIIQNNNIIYIYYDNENKKTNIRLNKNERYIKSFIYIGLDITIVEILDIDNIPKDYFLWNE